MERKNSDDDSSDVYSDCNSDCNDSCDECQQHSYNFQKRNRRYEQANKNEAPTKLKEILLNAPVGTAVSIKAQMFSINGYLRNGIQLEGKTYVRFIKNKSKKQGILVSENQKEFNVYYTNDSFCNNDGILPCHSLRFCDYNIPCMIIDNGNKQVRVKDKSKIDGVRIFYKDDIFEDWVHYSKGFIFENQDIEKLYAKKKQNI